MARFLKSNDIASINVSPSLRYIPDEKSGYAAEIRFRIEEFMLLFNFSPASLLKLTT